MEFKSLQMDRLLCILHDIVEDYDASENVEKYVKELISIYSDKNFRHSYNKISKFLEDLTADQRDQLPVVITIIMEKITLKIEITTEMNSSEELETINAKLYKLLDHINLEGIRINRMEAVQRISDNSKKVLAELNEQKKNNQALMDSINSLENKVNAFNTQSITILSIFAGLVLVFSSGIELFSQTFANLDAMNVYKICTYLLVIGMILFNIIFMMFYIVSKIACAKIAVSYSKTKKESTWFLYNLNNKYPYVVWFNVACLIAITLMIVAPHLKIDQ